MTLDVVRAGTGSLRVGAWRHDERLGYVAPVPGSPADAATVRQACAVLARRGFDRAVTAALAPDDAQGFVASGFTVREHLHLLWRDLGRGDLPEVTAGAVVRRAHRRDRPAVLAVDHRSFAPFWRLDDGGLDEALQATPSVRFRVATDTGGDPAVVGYAVFGRSGRQGFVQRLAVDRGHRRRGAGATLVVDGLRWLRRWGATAAVVNTQVGNDAALGLYESLGFRRQPGGLVVLEGQL